MPEKILVPIASQNIHGISVFMHAMAIPVNDIIEKIVTNPILVVCLTFTQQAPFTNLEPAPNRIMKNRKKPMKAY